MPNLLWPRSSCKNQCRSCLSPPSLKLTIAIYPFSSDLWSNRILEMCSREIYCQYNNIRALFSIVIFTEVYSRPAHLLFPVNHVNGLYMAFKCRPGQKSVFSELLQCWFSSFIFYLIFNMGEYSVWIRPV